MSEESDYLKYRGKCKEMSEALVRADPTLRLVRGHYYCYSWGEQAHWWCEDENGKVVDPTAKQFPSKGAGEYVEFNGWLSCVECGKEVQEQDARIEGSYGFCSTKCNAAFVGIYI